MTFEGERLVNRTHVPLLALTALLLVSPDFLFGSYKVVLKDGKIMEARTKPVSMEGQYRFTDTLNRFHVIPIDQIDIKATQAINSGQSPQAEKVRKIVTNDDISPAQDATVGPDGTVKPTAAPKRQSKSASTAQTQKGEAEWRARAKHIREKLAEVEKQIQDLREKQKSAKADGIKIGFDTYNQVIYANFESEIKELEKEREKIELMMRSLEEEARKAGALPGWLR